MPASIPAWPNRRSSNAQNATNRRGRRATAPLGGSFSLQRQPFRLALANVERRQGNEPEKKQPDPAAAAAGEATAQTAAAPTPDPAAGPEAGLAWPEARPAA